MENCTICGKPLKKEGRTEHYGCRMIKRVSKKCSKVIQLETTEFEQACKTLDKKPELLFKQF